MTTPYDRLAELGLSLPDAPLPVANFANAVRVGDLLYISGQGPVEADGTRHTGQLGAGVSLDSAYSHARLTGLNLIAVMHAELGDLAKVARIVKLLGMVNATPDFAEHPKVINGCSDLMVAVFGDKGVHARSAVGFSSLPFGISVEIEAIVAVED